MAVFNPALKRTLSLDLGTTDQTRAAVDRLPGWASLSLFEEMGPQELDALSDAMTTVHFEAGAELVRLGELGDAMYLVDDGAVRVEVPARDGAPGLERVLVAPAAIGEMALVTREPRTATVRARTDVRCMRIEKAEFEALCSEHPNVAHVLTRLVGDRLEEIRGIRHVGKYEVQRALGSGAVAEVFEAIHPDLGLPVALKMLSHAVVHHPYFADQFDREARLVAGLSHPNIVRVIDTARAYGTRFIVMERLRGDLLEEELGRGPLRPWSRLRRVVREIALALDYVHGQGLVHRDVKPSNVFLTEDGATKLLDFGIAIHAARSVCEGAARLGTPFYMPPEQVLGHALDGRTDLYALGVLAYEAATGTLPFDAPDLESLLRKQLQARLPDPRRRARDIPADLADFITRATQKVPDARFPSGAAAAAALADDASPQAIEPGERSVSISVRWPVERNAEVEAELAAIMARLEALDARAEVEPCS